MPSTLHCHPINPFFLSVLMSEDFLSILGKRFCLCNKVAAVAFKAATVQHPLVQYPDRKQRMVMMLRDMADLIIAQAGLKYIEEHMPLKDYDHAPCTSRNHLKQHMQTVHMK